MESKKIILILAVALGVSLIVIAYLAFRVPEKQEPTHENAPTNPYDRIRAQYQKRLDNDPTFKNDQRFWLEHLRDLENTIRHNNRLFTEKSSTN